MDMFLAFSHVISSIIGHLRTSASNPSAILFSLTRGVFPSSSVTSRAIPLFNSSIFAIFFHLISFITFNYYLFNLISSNFIKNKFLYIFYCIFSAFNNLISRNKYSSLLSQTNNIHALLAYVYLVS